jgi:hypothetical protein
MTATTPEMTPEIEEALKRYIDIQAEQTRLQEEKARLQERLKSFLAPTGGTQWQVALADERLKVIYREKTDVEYDEDVLRERLGDRYRMILSPDVRKIKAALGGLKGALEPYLPQIGSPDSSKVRDAVQSGLVTTDEFHGAFVKRRRQTVAVTRLREREDKTPPPERQGATEEPSAT